jgi:CHAD domain-containing protein
MAKRSTGAIAAGAAVAAGGAIAAGKVVRDVVAERAERKRARRFRLDPGETVREGIGRVVHGQLDHAIALVEGREGTGPEAVHDARKALKRLRAVLRLCRKELGKDRFRQENAILRDAGRALSDTRDAQVLVETLDGLRDSLGPDVPDDTWSRFHAMLVAEAQARAEPDGAGGYEQVVTALAGVRERVDGWPLPDDAGADALAAGLERIYASARRARRRAERDRSPERLHELRKRTKDVWYSGQLLTPVLPGPVGELRGRAHRLADVLGEHHDLIVLRERADSMPEAFGPGERELLDARSERRLRALEQEALDLAAKLYRRKAGELVRLLARA